MYHLPPRTGQAACGTSLVPQLHRILRQVAKDDNVEGELMYEVLQEVVAS